MVSCTIHIVTQRLLLQLLASVLYILSCEILDFEQQLSVFIDGIMEDKTTE